MTAGFVYLCTSCPVCWCCSRWLAWPAKRWRAVATGSSIPNQQRVPRRQPHHLRARCPKGLCRSPCNLSHRLHRGPVRDRSAVVCPTLCRTLVRSALLVLSTTMRWLMRQTAKVLTVPPRGGPTCRPARSVAFLFGSSVPPGTDRKIRAFFVKVCERARRYFAFRIFVTSESESEHPVRVSGA